MKKSQIEEFTISIPDYFTISKVSIFGGVYAPIIMNNLSETAEKLKEMIADDYVKEITVKSYMNPVCTGKSVYVKKS